MSELEQKNFDFNGKSRELRFLTDSLNKGIEINSKSDFDKISILLKENNLIDLSKNTFDSIIPNGDSFVIKKSNNGINIYGKNNNLITRGFRKYSNNFRLVGIITSGKQFQSLVGDEIYEQDENNLGEKIISNIDNIRNESKERLKTLNNSIKNEQIDITIKKGDRLWNLIKSNYKVTKNAQIVEILNHLCTLNKLKDSGNLIEIGQKVVFPKKIGINGNEYLIK